MRRCTVLSLMTGILCLLKSVNSIAQTTGPDSSSQQNAVTNATTFFYASLGKESPLFNGKEYYSYDPILKGNAYFLDVNSFSVGVVSYGGLTYKGVPLMYDVYSDEVVSLLYNKFIKFSLIKEKVSDFYMLDHHIVNIDSLSLPLNAPIKPGFYEEAYKGKLQVLVKRTKDIQSTTGTNTLESYFNPSIKYYIKKNNVYYEVSSKGSMLSVLKDKKGEIQQYIRSNQLNYRKDPIGVLAKVASYYDHITN